MSRQFTNQTGICDSWCPCWPQCCCPTAGYKGAGRLQPSTQGQLQSHLKHQLAATQYTLKSRRRVYDRDTHFWAAEHRGAICIFPEQAGALCCFLAGGIVLYVALRCWQMKSLIVQQDITVRYKVILWSPGSNATLTLMSEPSCLK